MKVTRAITYRGKCGLCPNEVVPGDRYYNFFRPASKEEIADPAVSIQQRPRRGPEVKYPVHVECHEKEVIRSREEARRKREERSMNDKSALPPTGVQTDNGLLKEMGEEVTACNIANGWFDVNPKVQAYIEWYEDFYGEDIGAAQAAALNQFFGPRTFGDDIALLHSEVSEMLEAGREGAMVTTLNEKGKPEGMPSEAADVLVRLLDTCKRYDIDLFAEWRQKLTYNWSRGHRHGGKVL